MHFRIADDLFRRFPTVCIGLVVAQGVANGRAAPAITDLLREAERETHHRFAAHGIRNEPALAAWRQAFTVLGISPSRYKSSVEALVARVLKGEPLPGLNPVVDLVNAISLTYLLPVGAHDLAQVHGDITVGPARPGSLFTPIGHLEQETVEAGEYVYADEREVRTRRWVWRQSDRSKVVAHSDTILFPIDGWIGLTDVAVHAAQGELVKHLERELGAQTRTFFLDRDHPSAVILKEDSLPDRVVTTDGGFRMAGLGYLESPHTALDQAPPAPAPIRISTQTPRHLAVAHGGFDPVGELLGRATVDVVVREELEARLRRGDRLRVKFGVDPTSPHLHLGHAVVLRKLRAFQELGHTICLVIGDFTAQIGDASDKTSMRQMLTEEQVYANMTTYKRQISQILDEQAVEWSYNNDWLAPLRFRDVVGLASNFTVAQLLERENFTSRYAAGQPIGLQEFLYPLLQGYDSVALKADIELGGTEQLFNLLAGRTLQRAFNQPPQAVVTLKLLLGLDGRKMSKSFSNTILLEDPPKNMYGKVMSIADEQIAAYFELCTDRPLDELGVMVSEIAGGTNPMGYKKQLAREITRLYHGDAQALLAQEAFEREIQGGKAPATETIPAIQLSREGQWPLADLLSAVGLVKSKSEARRKTEERAVRIDDDLVTDPNALIEVREGMVVQLGKRNFRKVNMPS